VSKCRVSTRDVRGEILATASELFYRNGTRAVGVDLIIAEAGVAKSSFYHHYRTKDDLIAAYVRSEDEAFWTQWDRVATPHRDDAHAAVIALVTWIGTKIMAPSHRGCPQLNVAAEIADETHPARQIAANHKQEMRRRLRDLAQSIGASKPDVVGDQLWLLIDGAFANHDLLRRVDPVELLVNAVDAIVEQERTRLSTTKRGKRK
jgi:AcrR family transcriptional regulator